MTTAPSDVAETLLDVDSEIASTVIDVSSDSDDDDDEDDDDGPDGTFLSLYYRAMPHFRKIWSCSILVCMGSVSFGVYRRLVRTDSCTLIWFLEDHMTEARQRFWYPSKV